MYFHFCFKMVILVNDWKRNDPAIFFLFISGNFKLGDNFYKVSAFWVTSDHIVQCRVVLQLTDSNIVRYNSDDDPQYGPILRSTVRGKLVYYWIVVEICLLAVCVIICIFPFIFSRMKKKILTKYTWMRKILCLSFYITDKGSQGWAAAFHFTLQVRLRIEIRIYLHTNIHKLAHSIRQTVAKNAFKPLSVAPMHVWNLFAQVSLGRCLYTFKMGTHRKMSRTVWSQDRSIWKWAPGPDSAPGAVTAYSVRFLVVVFLYRFCCIEDDSLFWLPVG